MNPLPEDVAAAAQELLGADLAYELSGAQVTAPPSLSIEQLDALLPEVEAGKQRLVCHPDDYPRVSEAVYGSGFGLHYTVMTAPLPEPGWALVMPSQRDVMAIPFPEIPY